MYPAFLTGNTEDIEKIFHDILCGITFHQHISEERYYHSLIHVALVAMGFEVKDEVPGSVGRSDITIFLPDNDRLIMEVKYRKEIESEAKVEPEPEQKPEPKPEPKPKDQIKVDKELLNGIKEAKGAIINKDYSGPFRLNARRIILIALAVYGRDDVMVEFIPTPE
jgi:hypothetical protein